MVLADDLNAQLGEVQRLLGVLTSVLTFVAAQVLQDASRDVYRW